MSIEIRGIERAELKQVLQLDTLLFGYAAEADEPEVDHLPLDRFLCAFDGGRMVGTSAVLPLELNLPGGAQVRMAGVTWVGVLMTHRRRGIMRRLVTEQLAAMEATGEPIAGLGASQSLLYRRFGFGPASRSARLEIESLHAGFITPLDTRGSLEHLELDAALEQLPVLHRRLQQARNGMASRPVALHRRAYKDAAKEKDGAGPVCFVAHRDGGGEVDGVVAYRIKMQIDQAEIFENELRIVEMLATTEAASAALWRHCLDHDLVRRVVYGTCPADDPAADRLADPRRWVLRLHDDLHLRPVDVPALLGARRYSREDALTIGVRDPLFERCGGRFRIEGGLDAASCTRVDAMPDLVLDTATLGSMLLGDAPVERLHRAGLVDEHTAGAVRRATAMFAWSPLPWASYMF